jgi:hypothetical protein
VKENCTSPLHFLRTSRITHKKRSGSYVSIAKKGAFIVPFQKVAYFCEDGIF